MNAVADTAVQEFFDWQDGLARRSRPVDEARNHERLLGRLHAQLREHLRGLPARVWAGGPALRIAEAGCDVHPDLVVSADEADVCGGRPLRAPSLLIEIATAATAEADRGTGFERARQLASLREYVVVEAGCRRIDVYRRRAAGDWLLERHEGSDPVVLESVGFGLDPAALYVGSLPA